jgi:hypothetical protein
VGAGEGAVVTDGTATGDGKALLLAGWQAARKISAKKDKTFFIIQSPVVPYS